ncbi:MAG: hypothetical protein A2147_04455 [Chloroflexi bacterium RBG_16_57_8]|nr:MAG: hypothetical protein A2147_04455 [Chloroflexi bacterium RBG_16_57_8]
MDVTLTVDTKDPRATNDFVRRIYGDRLGPDLFARVERTLTDIVRLFAGRYPGYAACDTIYHDLEHTLQAYLAAARIFDGMLRATPRQVSDRDVALGLISTLGHDTGYIKKSGDRTGTGAKYSLVHVDRSREFMSSYLSEQNFDQREIRCVNDMISCTGLTVDVSRVLWHANGSAAAGFVVGTADYLGQMSDPCYPQKLPGLYQEYVEGNVEGYESAQDLLVKTPEFFHGFVMKRLEDDYRGVYRFAENHFGGENRYLLGIERNLALLERASGRGKSGAFD